MASGDGTSCRWPHTERRLAPARRGSRPSLHLCRPGVLVGPAVSIPVVLPGAVLHVRTATGHRSGAAGLRPGGACSGPAAAGLLVLLSQRRSLLSDHADLPRSMGAGPTEARVAFRLGGIEPPRCDRHGRRDCDLPHGRFRAPRGRVRPGGRRQGSGPRDNDDNEQDGSGERSTQASHRSTSHFFFSRTSSRGADHGYGLISISAGSSTRGPIAIGQ